ncbi:thioesterase domain-containing protein [Micromonospora echinospora]|uniref:thioesterase II family protein n=1 Tax=Micromonospora echinospora TaxID=1877 RepID=UPI0034266856
MSESSGLALACIPWAGAGASPFRPWGPVVGEAATVYGVRLAGRESRQTEPPTTSLAQVVDETVRELARLGVSRIALFGQCSGALLAFELARALLRSGHDIEVTHLVVASQLPPSVFATIDVESGQDLMQYVPEDFREEPDFVEVLLPIIAADMNLVSGYVYARDVPLEAPITAIYGGRDKMLDRAKVDGWRLETTGPTNFYEVAGGDHLLGGAAWLKLARIVRAVLT